MVCGEGSCHGAVSCAGMFRGKRSTDISNKGEIIRQTRILPSLKDHWAEGKRTLTG
jgi:hypothetical protein